ncbi:MAG: hypothetical protein JRC92_10410 [Deltaproteobacteria bacterium]|nr:hypothetical protein [Deltaproteobacteria bacterium]
MSWRTEWKAISARIEGLSEAGRLFAQLCFSQSADPYGTMKNVLLPHAQSVFNDIKQYKESYQSILPPAAATSIDRFIEDSRQIFESNNINKKEGFKFILPCLASFRAEFTFQLSDNQAEARRITELAFVHLQRLIIADQYYKKRWGDAFREGETACEKLGAVHLLHHGVWAFKASAENERTDLILGEPLKDLSQVESTAVALVLTEWKVIRSSNELNKQAKQAFKQASVYGSSSLAGFELAGYRYLILVSEGRIEMPPDRNENGVIYQHINIPVKPKYPSSH